MRRHPLLLLPPLVLTLAARAPAAAAATVVAELQRPSTVRSYAGMWRAMVRARRSARPWVDRGSLFSCLVTK